jgi:hypothetical protein
MRLFALILVLYLGGCASGAKTPGLETLVYPEDVWLGPAAAAPGEHWAEPGDIVWLRVWRTRPPGSGSWTEDSIRLLEVQGGRAKFVVRRRQGHPEAKTPDSFVGEGETTAQTVFTGGVGYVRLPEPAAADVEFNILRIDGERVFYRLQKRDFPCNKPLCIQD